MGRALGVEPIMLQCSAFSLFFIRQTRGWHNTGMGRPRRSYRVGCHPHSDSLRAREHPAACIRPDVHVSLLALWMCTETSLQLHMLVKVNRNQGGRYLRFYGHQVQGFAEGWTLRLFPMWPDLCNPACWGHLGWWTAGGLTSAYVPKVSKTTETPLHSVHVSLQLVPLALCLTILHLHLVEAQLQVLDLGLYRQGLGLQLILRLLKRGAKGKGEEEEWRLDMGGLLGVAPGAARRSR